MSKKKITKGLIKEREKAHKKAFEKEYSGVKKRFEHYCKNSGHRTPSTRREFLNAGILSMQGWMLGPAIGTLLGSLSKTAYAADCQAPDAVSGPAALVHIHAQGGSAIMLAGVPRQTSGAELDSFTNIGLGGIDPDNDFTQPFANDARFYNKAGAGQGFLNGILDTTDAATRANTVQVTCPMRDNGDSSAPQKLFLGQVEALGRAGDKLGFMGQDSSATGTNAAPNSAFALPPTQPLAVNSLNDILQAVQLSGALQNLNQPQQESLAKLIMNLSNSQTQKLAGLSGAENLAKAVECATEQNLTNIEQGAGNLTPSAGVQAIWNNFTNVDLGGRKVFRNEALGSMVYNTVSGNAAGCVLEVGGYDIHVDRNSGRGVQEQNEYALGQTVGRALQTAALVGKKVCVVFTTNGSNNCAGSTTNDAFNSDSSSYSANHMWFYDPAAPPVTVGNLNAQLGGLQANGVTDNSAPFSTISGSLAAMIYNYAIFSGVESKYDLVMGGNTLNAAQKALARKLQS